jgi:two-component system response regulator MprA
MAERPARVLIADDDSSTRDVLRRFLGEKGFEVATAEDGANALEIIGTFAPDVVLLDIRMPEVDGIECLQRINEDAYDCGVIMISGEADAEVARRALSLGAADFIYKPFDLEYLETSLLAKLLAMGKP